MTYFQFLLQHNPGGAKAPLFISVTIYEQKGTIRTRDLKDRKNFKTVDKYHYEYAIILVR